MNPTKGVPPLIVSIKDPERCPNQCAWFLSCEEPASEDVKHPTLGWVPCCPEHLAWLMDDSQLVEDS